MFEDTVPPIRLFSIASLASKGRWRIEAMRTSSDHLFLWITRGQGRITVSGITRGYGPHSAIIVPAGYVHSFEVGRQVLGTAVYLPPTSDLYLPDEPVQYRVPEPRVQSELTGILDAMRNELDGDAPDHQRASQLHAGLLGVWMARQDHTPFAPQEYGAASDRLAADFTDRLERDFRTGKSITAYARDMGITATHLTRACRSACGKSASTLLSDRVIAEAQVLLKDTDRPIGEISARLGFASPGYFSRSFHHCTGLTPSGFRKSG